MPSLVNETLDTQIVPDSEDAGTFIVPEVCEDWPNALWEAIRNAKDGSLTLKSAPLETIHEHSPMMEQDLASLYGDAGSENQGIARLLPCGPYLLTWENLSITQSCGSFHFFKSSSLFSWIWQTCEFYYQPLCPVQSPWQSCLSYGPQCGRTWALEKLGIKDPKDLLK